MREEILIIPIIILPMTLDVTVQDTTVTIQVLAEMEAAMLPIPCHMVDIHIGETTPTSALVQCM